MFAATAPKPYKVIAKQGDGTERAFTDSWTGHVVCLLNRGDGITWLTAQQLADMVGMTNYRPGEALDVFLDTNAIYFDHRASSKAAGALFYKRSIGLDAASSNSYYGLCAKVVSVQMRRDFNHPKAGQRSAGARMKNCETRRVKVEQQTPPRHPVLPREHLRQPTRRVEVVPPPPPPEDQPPVAQHWKAPSAPKKASTSRFRHVAAKSSVPCLPRRRQTMAEAAVEVRLAEERDLKRKRGAEADLDSIESDSDDSWSDSDSDEARPSEKKRHRLDVDVIVDEERAERAMSRAFQRQDKLAREQIKQSRKGGKKQQSSKNDKQQKPSEDDKQQKPSEDDKPKAKRGGMMADKAETACPTCGKTFVGEFGLHIHYGIKTQCDPKNAGGAAAPRAVEAAPPPPPAAPAPPAVPAPADPVPRMYHFSVPVGLAEIKFDGPKCNVSFNVSGEHTSFSMD